LAFLIEMMCAPFPPRRGHQDNQSPPEETDRDEATLRVDPSGILEGMRDAFEDLGGVGEV